MKYQGPTRKNDKGETAVLYSPGFGAGWSSWGSCEERLFCPELVDLVLAGDKPAMARFVAKKWPDEYAGGLDNLTVAWLPPGTTFRIYEYDGSESVDIVTAETYYEV